MQSVVEARNLALEGKGRTLLSHFHMELAPGKCTVVLGPEKSGKSLLLKTLAGIYPISAGELFIDGINVRQNPIKSKYRMGYIPELKQLDGDFSALDNLYIFSRLFGVKPNSIKDFIKSNLREFQIEEYGGIAADQLKPDIIERFYYVRSLINDPRLVIYDQPGDSKDLQQWVSQFINHCRSQKRGVVLATDSIETAQKIADYVIVLNDGKIVFEGAPKELMEEHVGQEVVEFTIRAEDVDYYTNKIKGTHSYQYLHNKLKIYLKAGQDALATLNLVISDDIRLRKISLRDVYDWKLTNKNKEYA